MWRADFMKSVAVTAFSLCLVAAAPAEARTVDEVIAGTLEAQGGEDNWRAVERLCLRGTYSAFSTPQPFAACRQTPNLYRFEHMLLDARIVLGHDGQRPWWINQSIVSPVTWATEPPPHYRAVIDAEAEIGGPFLDTEARGHQIELAGEVDLDGERLLELTVTLRGGGVERWYLDPDSLLPRTRLSKGAAGPTPAEQRIDFYDYREVDGGIRVPHRLEIEIGYNFEVMEIAEVEVNGELADGYFSMPLPKGMEALQSLAGTWQVRYESRPNPGVPFAETGEVVVEIHPLSAGALLEEEITYPTLGVPRRVRRWRSWDRFAETYRVTLFDSLLGHVDVLEGDLEDGRLKVSNTTTGTVWSSRGQTFHTREETYAITPDSFEVDLSISADGGETWMRHVHFVYTRIDPSAAAR